jgi:hypothetical protein
LDLWVFDDLGTLDDDSLEAPPKSLASVIPVPRDLGKKSGVTPPPSSSSPLKQLDSQDYLKINVGKSRPKIQPVGPAITPPKADGDFEELDHWVEPRAARISEDAPPPPAPRLPLEEPSLSSASENVTPPPTPTPPRPPVAASDQDELFPSHRDNVAPVSFRFRLKLSIFEKVGLVALLLLLAVGGWMIFLNTVERLPTGAERVKGDDFPIKGALVSILSAETYWRAPVTAGKNADVFRRGTQLLPVLELTTSGGPAAVRVLFRNQDGELVGDAVTRLIRPGASLQIAATAGFDDVGMHAAYRTGQAKLWTVEVDEAPSESSKTAEFKKLFEMDISPDRR